MSETKAASARHVWRACLAHDTRRAGCPFGGHSFSGISSAKFLRSPLVFLCFTHPDSSISMSSHPFTPTRLSSPRASFASRIAFILLSLLASSQLAAAAPRFRPSTLTNPHPHGPTPQVAIPARPKITAYADFDHHLRRRTPNWRENHGVGHAWKRSEVEDLPDDLFTDKVEFARRGLVKAVVKEIRAAAPKPTTSTRKATTTTTRPRSSTTTSSKTTTSSSKAPVTTTSSPSSSPTTSSPASTSSSSSSSTTSSSTTSASSTSSSSATTTSSSLVPTSTLAPCVGSEVSDLVSCPTNANI